MNLYSLFSGDKKNIIAPRDGDVGYDLVAQSVNVIGHRCGSGDFYGELFKSISYVEIDTGIKIVPPKDHYSLIFPRSSVTKYNLILKNSIGVVDPDYRDTLKLRFLYVPQPQDYLIYENRLLLEVDYDKIYKVGDKCGQLVFAKIVKPKLIEADLLDDTVRGLGGFGSTDELKPAQGILR